MSSLSMRRELARQQRSRERGRQWEARWYLLRRIVREAGAGVGFLWGFAAGAWLTLLAEPARIVVAAAVIGCAVVMLCWRRP